MQRLARWILTPENRSATAAAQGMLGCLSSGRARRVCNPVYLHGPAGCGKTHLVQSFVGDFLRQHSDATANILAASDVRARAEAASELLREVGTCDLLVLEGLQHLTAASAEPLVQLFDERLLHERQMVFTANIGPRDLPGAPYRLTSRLAAGLVVSLQPFGPASRLRFLEERVGRRQLAIRPDVLAWLADRLPGSGRQLDAAAARLESLVKQHGHLPDLATVARDFESEARVAPLLNRIIERVSRYFQVEQRQIQSRRRSHKALIPRQVGMYLARRLTPLSLEEIGASFGGRDHSTVLHACRKIANSLDTDAGISGAVRQLQAELV